MTTPEEVPLIGVILAAGTGTRILPFSERWPKPVLPMLGKPLVQHQLECLRDLGVQRVVIVIGHFGYEIVRALGDGSSSGVNIEYVDQGPTLGIAHALGKLESRINGPFMLFLGDIFFVHRGLHEMTSLLGKDDVRGVLAVKEETSVAAIRRNFVVIEEGGFVTRVIEKPRHPLTRLKGCGLYLFDPVFFDAVRRTPRTAMRDEYEITDAIQIFLDDGHRVKAARVIDNDLNLTYPRDLLDMNMKVLGDRNLMAAGVKLHPGARIERSVLMAGARVDHPVLVRECLMFPGAAWTAASDVERHIITTDQVVDCR